MINNPRGHFNLFLIGSTGTRDLLGNRQDRNRLDRGLKPCTGRCCHTNCSAQGKDLYTGSQSMLSGSGTRRRGSTRLSGKRAGHHQCTLAGKCRQALGPLADQFPRYIGRPGRMGSVDKGCPS